MVVGWMDGWMKTLTSQTAVATDLHLHVASLRSLYPKHAELKIWLGRGWGHSPQQQKGRWVQTGRGRTPEQGRGLASVAFTH